MKLWSINRVLRWSGFRIVISFWDGQGPVREPTRIDLNWVGFPGSKGWAQWEPHNRTPIRSLFGRAPFEPPKYPTALECPDLNQSLDHEGQDSSSGPGGPPNFFTSGSFDED